MLIFLDLCASLRATRNDIIPFSINTFIRESIQQEYYMKKTDRYSSALADRFLKNLMWCAVMKIGIHLLHTWKLRNVVSFGELDFDQLIHCVKTFESKW